MEDYAVWIWSFIKTLFYIVIGSSVRVLHYSRGKSISARAVAITLSFSVFVGVIVNHILIIRGLEQWAGVAVSISALLGESLVVYLITNSNNIFRTFIKSVFKVDIKDEDKGADEI